MQVLFLTYANDPREPLPGLREEDDQVYRLLSPRALRQHFLLHRDSYTTLEKIASFLSLYRRHIRLFHYSGHAGRDRLLLEGQDARAEGIAHLLGQCARHQLKVVLLNGCSTQGQVEALLDAGVPVVIATSAPVADQQAQRFAVCFFQALSEQATYGEAFELAAGQVLGSAAVEVQRGLAPRRQAGADGPLWGIFYREANQAVLEEKLPAQTTVSQPGQYRPNERLTGELWDLLAPYSRKIQLQKALEAEGDPIEEGDKHVAVLNSLPRPVAEHLRKLMAPVESEKQGYDKISEARIRQMVTAYETVMELLCFILLAELWAARIADERFGLPAGQRERIRGFLQLRGEARAGYDFEPLLRECRQALHERPLVVTELQQLDELLDGNPPFRDACFFFQLLQQRLRQDGLDPYEIPECCIRGEESLIALLRPLGFLARYTLAAVKNIDVLRYPHLTDTQFSHAIVRLMRVFGKLQEEQLVIDRFLYNRSVLLLKNEGAPTGARELCLSPFIIDENAFDLKTDLSKLYFFEAYRPQNGSYYYKHINRPDDPPLEAAAGRYELAKSQFDVFTTMLLTPNAETL